MRWLWLVQVSVLTAINNINLPDSLTWTATKLSVSDDDSTFPVPTPFLLSALGGTSVKIQVQTAQQEPPRFALFPGEEEDPPGMDFVFNGGISPVRLDFFRLPIYAFSTYIRVGTAAVWAIMHSESSTL